MAAAGKNKAAMIARLDGYIGQLTDQLQKLGMTNNAAIFFFRGRCSELHSDLDAAG